MDYPALQARAASLIASDGQQLTLTRHEPGAYDPATATVAITDAPTVTTGVILPLPSRGLSHLALANMPGSDIRAGDQILLLPGDIAEPGIGDTVSIGGVPRYTIIGINPLNPGGTALYYECFIRGAG